MVRLTPKRHDCDCDGTPSIVAAAGQSRADFERTDGDFTAEDAHCRGSHYSSLNCSAINSSPDNGALDDRSPNDDDHTDHGPFGGRLRVLSAALPVEGELTCPPDGLSILSNPLCLAARRTFCTRRTFCNSD